MVFSAGVGMPPDGGFLCGALVCKVGVQSCTHYVGFTMFDACEAYPADCDPAQGGALSCLCLEMSSACACAQDSEGNFVLKCNTGS